jgi:hypothetical protein
MQQFGSKPEGRCRGRDFLSDPKWSKEEIMAHMVETMCYTGETPWHGLGVKVDSAPSSAEAIKLAGLDWDVVQTPVMVNGKEIPNYLANVRDSDGAVLGITSDKYKPVQNREAFDFTDAMIGAGCKYETAGSLKGGKLVWLLALTDSRKILGDERHQLRFLIHQLVWFVQIPSNWQLTEQSGFGHLNIKTESMNEWTNSGLQWKTLDSIWICSKSRLRSFSTRRSRHEI